MIAEMADDPLQTPLRFLPGVGEKRAELLARLGLLTAEDILWRLPRDILDLTRVVSARDLVEDEFQTVRGTIAETDGRETRRGPLISALVDCGDDFVRGLWFNQPWMRRQLPPGASVLFSGKPKRRQGRFEFMHPRVQFLGEDDPSSNGGVIPRYGLTEGLRHEEMRRVVHSALEAGLQAVADPLPDTLRRAHELLPLQEALQRVHEPPSPADYEAGRRRLVFEDLLQFQIGVSLRRRAWSASASAPVLQTTAKIDARIRRLFPFRLTAGQDAAVRDIVADLASGRAMHRLLQADVGAGKTVVAIYALLVAIAAGWQGALMAPTELLAMQHWRTIEEFLAHSRVRRAFLTGGLSTSRRAALHQAIAAGELDLIVGTQAMIQEGVRFPRLGVAVVDEQHKFGVAQRSRFADQEDGSPHILVMTATPIPRSLCLAQFGDLDLSVVADLPPGRQRVVTSRVPGPASRKKVWAFLREQIRTGRQAYVICPLVDAADAVTGAAGAAQVYAELAQTEFQGLTLGLVHGQMDREQRDSIMQRFHHGELQALVATTVVEVGIDAPNATLLVVLDAERFGLSQLHQLRGRISRGVFQGYCFLFSDSAAADASARLAAMESTSDGFRIAEIDFELRGPGDVLGTRQSGELPLRVADLVRDKELLEEAHRAAQVLVETGAIDQPDYAPLKIQVLDRFARLMNLPRTG